MPASNATPSSTGSSSGKCHPPSYSRHYSHPLSLSIPNHPRSFPSRLLAIPLLSRRLLGDKSPFTSQQGLLTEGADRDEEAARIQYLAEIAKYLGLTPTVDPDAIQGKGSYESRAEMLHLIVELVEASTVTDIPEWSVDDQVAKDILLVDAIAEKQTQVFSDECKLFPADVPITSYCIMHELADLERQLAEQLKSVEQLQASVAELSAKQSYNPNEDYTDAEIELRARLATFLDSAKSFNVIYAKEIRPWTHMMDVPQLHGLGPAANRLLYSYGQLLKLLRNLQKMRDSYSAVAAGSDVAADAVLAIAEESSLVKLVAECEEALLLLNNGLSILSLSLERDFTA
ncbi:hypothetical protein M758_11G160700 [Ceratodon purpureus]|uniref:AUGMIN subunit 7 n=1 Tax=Ceratodon purpureus TaxID=3225 RepID=A0A8T0GLI2_CERPU|nr:hypothetical protein KC19_11G164900 [Ceratodon purpureus]KAG0602104.1 hypothetical protein M758_11G160700 [Ceratodon purpureus]